MQTSNYIFAQNFGRFIAALVFFLAAQFGYGQSEVLFSDNFGSYAPGSNLTGQGGWGGAGYPDVQVVYSSNFNSNVIDGQPMASNAGQTNWAFHSLTESLQLSEITGLTFNAFELYDSNDASVYLTDDSLNNLTGYAVGWATSGFSGWGFDAREITGHPDDPAYAFIVPGGVETPVSLAIVVDGTDDTVFGLYDFGSGLESTPSFSVSPAAITALSNVAVLEDFRSGWQGAEFDNIIVTATSTVPDSGATWLLLCLSVGTSLFVARRRTRSFMFDRDDALERAAGFAFKDQRADLQNPTRNRNRCVDLITVR
jgi:hypothetical protein